MRKGVSLLIVTALLFSTMLVFAVPTTSAAPAQGGKTILFITGYGMGMPWTNITSWLTSQGHTVRNATTINATNLAGVDALILCSPYGAAGRAGFNSTGAPAILAAITTWWLTGSKFLWVSADSDYYSVGVAGDWIPLNCSAILAAVGSPLRFEPMSVEDPKSNCGSAYRVAVNTTVTTGEAAAITAGVTNPVLFHGPTCLYALDAAGTPVALENVTVANVFPIMRTGGSGKVLDGEPTHTGIIHVAGRTGSWVMMAGQKYAGLLGNSKIIASGASPYADYQCMYSNAYYGRVLDGALLCQNAYKWGLTVETVSIPPIPGFPLAAIALGLGLVLVPTIIFRRRRQH
jgi:hypothetical protein